jgi:mycofactocin glycosyltransferase
VKRRLLETGAGSDSGAQRLARRLVDAGLAHPRPGPGNRNETTVVIPVRDRASALDACLAAVGGPAIVVDDGSIDPQAISAVCERHRAQLIRREVSEGPASARNAGLALVKTSLVAFVDSDCVPEPRWLERLVGHFADPDVAAVAPRIRAVSRGNGPVARFAVTRSPIDLGRHPSRVVPMGKVSYIPTAALLVRTAAIERGFDERLRFGEDVDLVWRLDAQGMTVRFDPSVSVFHHEPTRWTHLLARHFRYGTSAAELAKRHPGKLAPVVLNPWACALAIASLGGHLRVSGLLAGVRFARIGSASLPEGLSRLQLCRESLVGAVKMTLGLGHVLAMFAPGLLLAGLRPRSTRRASLLLLLGPPTFDWLQRRPKLDPIRWAFLSLCDDAAYGLGVWVGCVRHRTLEPVSPHWSVGRGDVPDRSFGL